MLATRWSIIVSAPEMKGSFCKPLGASSKTQGPSMSVGDDEKDGVHFFVTSDVRSIAFLSSWYGDPPYASPLPGIRPSKQIILGEPKPLAFVVAALVGAFIANEEHLLEPLLLDLMSRCQNASCVPWESYWRRKDSGGGRRWISARPVTSFLMNGKKRRPYMTGLSHP